MALSSSSSGSFDAQAVANAGIYPAISVRTIDNIGFNGSLNTTSDPVFQICRTERRFQFIGEYTCDCYVTLGSFDPATEEIRYTLGGQRPTNKSRLYSGELLFNRNMTGSDNTIMKCRIYNKNNPMIRSSVTTFELRVYTDIGL